MPIKLSEKFVNEREEICNKIISILNLDGKIKSLTISKKNKLTFWTKDYLFNYDNLHKEKLCEILL